MTKMTRLMLVVMLVGGWLAQGGAMQAQAPGQNHIDHVLKAFRGTPEGVGLLQAAIKEAEIASRHADLALKDRSDKDAMMRHLGHVLNALDVDAMAEGPGLGYGVKKAAEGVIQHLGLAAKADGASDSLKTHAGHATGFANNTLALIEEIKRHKDQADASGAAADAARHVEMVQGLVKQLVDGTDDKPGLAAAEKHLGMIS